MSSLGEDTSIITDNESLSKSEATSRSSTDDIKFDKFEETNNPNEIKISPIKCDNVAAKSNIPDENKNQTKEQFKLKNSAKSIPKSVAFKETYSSESLDNKSNNNKMTRLCGTNNDNTVLNNTSGLNRLEANKDSSSKTNKINTSTLHSTTEVQSSHSLNNILNSKYSSSILDNYRQNKNDNCTVTSSNGSTNNFNCINGKNNLFNKNLNSNNKSFKLSDTAKQVGTAERLKMFEKLSAQTATSKMKKETLVSNKTNFQKAREVFNRE